MKRSWSWLSFVAGAVLAAAAVGVPWIVASVQQAEADAYTACLNAQGFYEGDPDTDLDELIIASEACV